MVLFGVVGCIFGFWGVVMLLGVVVGVDDFWCLL